MVKRVQLPPMGPRRPNPTRQSGSSPYQYQLQQNTRLSQQDTAALPILKSPKKENAVIKWVMERMRMAATERNRRAQRCQDIDVQMSGYINHNADDRKRDRDNKSGKTPKPTDHNLPLTQAQINECVTYLMSVFAPEMSIFESVAPADRQQLAQALIAEINKNGQRGQYYRHLAKFCLNAVKYNFSAMTNYYEEYQGIVYKNKGGSAVKQNGTLWAGNAINSVDVYNFFYDQSVHPVDLPMKGEFFAEVERVTPFRVRKLADDGKLFGIERYVEEEFVSGGTQNSASNSFYASPPSVRDPTNNAPGQINWQATLRGGEVKESAPGIEIVTFTTWIIPKNLGFSVSDEMELWRLKIANGKWLTFAAKLEDTHGMLPIVCATPSEDDLKNEQRTYAEQLIPLQHFASFLLNSHQAAVRKAIGGITVYNPHVIPGLDLSRDDLIGARIPIKSTATDFDIDKAFRHYDTAPKTDQHVDMIAKVMSIAQKILPTDTAKQVADLERATLYQAAATVQAGDRRNLTIACLIADQALTPLKYQMVYNIYSKKPSLSFIDPVTGAREDIPIGNFIEVEIENEIGTGLKGLDRLMQVQIMRDVINAVIQSQQAIQEIDIVLLLNYFSTLAGDRTDLTQFRRKPPVTPGTPTQTGTGPTGSGTPPGTPNNVPNQPGIPGGGAQG